MVTTERGGEPRSVEVPFSNRGTLLLYNAALFLTDTYVQTDGTTDLEAGVLGVDDLDLRGGTLQGVGSILGDVRNAGAIVPGGKGWASAGAIRVQGDYVQTAAGRLDIEIDGDICSRVDHLYVDGVAHLSGELNIAVLSCSPLFWQQFGVMTYGSRSGVFDAVTPGYDVQYLDHDVFVGPAGEPAAVVPVAESPTPSVSPSPSETPTAEASATPQPTSERTPSVTPEPSSTATDATATPTLDATPEPSGTPSPTAEATPQPMATEDASAEPSQTATAAPTATATEEVSGTPTPEATATATVEAGITATSEPTATPAPTSTPEPTSTPTEEPAAMPTATATREPTLTPAPEPTDEEQQPEQQATPAGTPVRVTGACALTRPRPGAAGGRDGVGRGYSASAQARSWRTVPTGSSPSGVTFSMVTPESR